MSFFKRNHNSLIALSAIAALLWAVQLSADWYQPPNEIGLAQFKKTEYAHTIQLDKHDNSRAFRLDSKSDPVALHAAFAVHAVFGPGPKPGIDAAPARIRSLTSDLPAIRAPPYHLQSA